MLRSSIRKTISGDVLIVLMARKVPLPVASGKDDSLLQAASASALKAAASVRKRLMQINPGNSILCSALVAIDGFDFEKLFKTVVSPFAAIA